MDVGALRKAFDTADTALYGLEVSFSEASEKLYEIRDMLSKIRYKMKSRQGIRGEKVDEYCEMLQCINTELDKLFEER